MRSSELYSLLDQSETPGGLREAIAPAMPEFRRGLAEVGRSVPILLETLGAELRISPHHVSYLCEEYLEGKLDEVELQYVATALELSPDFQCTTDEVTDALFLLATPAANGPLTARSVRAVRDQLASPAA